ncbi:hypothetical protein [Roseateles sp.]
MVEAQSKAVQPDTPLLSTALAMIELAAPAMPGPAAAAKGAWAVLGV